MSAYTVIGVWLSDKRHVIGVVEGDHEVVGGYGVPGYDEGLFAELVEADSWEEAEEQVHGTTEDDEDDDE